MIGLEDNVAIYLLGSGVFSFFDVTLLTQKILKECRTVYHLVGLHTFERYLKEITRNPVNLHERYYVDGRVRKDIYADIVQLVVEGGLRERPVALLMHGHPLVYSDISRGVLEESARQGLKVEVVPAVSSLDRLFVDLKLDIGLKGIQVFEATALILKEIRINTAVDCLLFQVGMVLNPLASRSRPLTVEEVQPLKNYLLKFYPPHHRVKLAASSVELGFKSQVTEVELSRLEEASSACHYTSSLYVPALDSHTAFKG